MYMVILVFNNLLMRWEGEGEVRLISLLIIGIAGNLKVEVRFVSTDDERKKIPKDIFSPSKYSFKSIS